MMSRCRSTFLAVLALALLAAPLIAAAQQAGKAHRIGFLSSSSAGANPGTIAAFRRGLAAHGWVEGHNIEVDCRYADGHTDRLSALAIEMLRRDATLIVAALPPDRRRADRTIASAVPTSDAIDARAERFQQ